MTHRSLHTNGTIALSWASLKHSNVLLNLTTPNFHRSVKHILLYMRKVIVLNFKSTL